MGGRVENPAAFANAIYTANSLRACQPKAKSQAAHLKFQSSRSNVRRPQLKDQRSRSKEQRPKFMRTNSKRHEGGIKMKEAIKEGGGRGGQEKRTEEGRKGGGGGKERHGGGGRMQPISQIRMYNSKTTRTKSIERCKSNRATQLTIAIFGPWVYRCTLVWSSGFGHGASLLEILVLELSSDSCLRVGLRVVVLELSSLSSGLRALVLEAWPRSFCPCAWIIDFWSLSSGPSSMNPKMENRFLHGK